MQRGEWHGMVSINVSPSKAVPVEDDEEQGNVHEAELADYDAPHLNEGSPTGSPKQTPIASPESRAYGSKSPSGDDGQLSMDLGISKARHDTSEPGFRFGQKDTWEWVATSGNPRKLHTKRVQGVSKRSNRKALGGSGVKPGSVFDESVNPSEVRFSVSAPTKLSFEVSQADSVAESVVSNQERQRNENTKQLETYVSMLPGSEEGADPREKAHLKRLLTSADGLAPVRYSFQRLGIDEVNRIVYQEEDASKLIHTLSADIYTGLWSCCRKTNAEAPGCRTGPHSDHLFLCVRCGAIFDPNSRKDGPHECFYHPGALNRSKAGGVWWSCCGAVGFKNSLLHSEKGDIHGAQQWRWGCKKESTHRPVSVMDANVDIRKFEHCTIGTVRHGARAGINESSDMQLFTDQEWVEDDQDVTCLRVSGITVIAQPLLPVIIGLQLHFENVTNGEIADGDRRVGDPGRIAEFDHLRKIREERFDLEVDEYLVRFEGSNSPHCITDLTVCTNKGRRHTFFQAWKEENNEQSLYDLQQAFLESFAIECEPHERIVGLQYGLGESMHSLGLLTQDRLAADHASSAELVRRCTLCASFFLLNQESAKCKFHTGFWTPQRRVRLSDSSSMPKCGASCEARACGRKCNKYEHRTHVLVHSCGDSQCAENCSMEGCPRRCTFSDHFHGTNDPMAVHWCGKVHPCRNLCICGKQCKFVAARGEPVHTQHWCGSLSGCPMKCDVAGCNAQCVHPNHHHALEADCFHECNNPHPCGEICSAAGCDGVCTGDRYGRHRHKCENWKNLGCLCQCSVEGCTNRCIDENHFHNDMTSEHSCGQVHYCAAQCSAPGCESTCNHSREEVHDVHECLEGHEIDCRAHCSVPGCQRRCANKDHFHGLDLVKKVTAEGTHLEPKERHLCAGEHRCEGTCQVHGCTLPCIIDKKDIEHECFCGGTIGCRHRCHFSEITGCTNYCCSDIHEHLADIHLCGASHPCVDLCARAEPCLWDGPRRKNARKVCSKRIPAGDAAHEGPHDCCGKHARPVAFSYTEEPDRCMQRCEKRGCRRRCQFLYDEYDHELWADGEPVHVCDQVMCLDVCPYPDCERVCNLAHAHSILDPASRHGCCTAHRTFDDATRVESSHDAAAQTQNLGTRSAPAGSRTLRKLYEIRASREVALAKQRKPPTTKRMQQDRRTRPASAAGGRAAQDAPIRMTKTAKMREHLALGGTQHMLLSGFVPGAVQEAWAEAAGPSRSERRPSPNPQAASEAAPPRPTRKRGSGPHIRPFSAPSAKRDSL